MAQGLPLSVTHVTRAWRSTATRSYGSAVRRGPGGRFLPATGRLADWSPATAPPCRWDAGLAAGSAVGVEFDPTLANHFFGFPS